MAANQNENRRKNTSAVLKTIGLVLLTVALIFAAARVIAGTDPADLLSVLTKSSDTVSADGYILEVEDEEIRRMLPFSTGVSLLGKDKMLYVQSGGNAISVTQHTFQNPQVVSSDRSMLVYDLGGTAYRIEKNGAIYAEKQTQAALMCAAVGEDGNYAVATYAQDGYQSRVNVYKEDGTLLYEWGSARDFVTGITLSDDGKQIAVCVVGSENANYYSKLFVFEIGQTEPLYSYTFSDATVLAMDFMKNDNLLLVSDSFVTVVKNGVEEKLMTFVEGSLVAYSVSHDEAVGVLLSSGTDENSSQRVYMWDRSATPVISGLAVDKNCSRISVNAKHLVVAGEKSVYQYDKTGASCGTFNALHAVEDVLLVKQSVFCLTEKGLSVFSVYNREAIEMSTELQ